MSEPVTKDDLEQATTQLRGEMKEMGAQLRGEMKEMGAQLRGEMKEMEDRLVQQMDKSAAHVANVMSEHLRAYVVPVDEKYKDLPGSHQELRADFEAHAADLHLHRRLPPAPAKRVRRPRSQ